MLELRIISRPFDLEGPGGDERISWVVLHTLFRYFPCPATQTVAPSIFLSVLYDCM